MMTKGEIPVGTRVRIVENEVAQRWRVGRDWVPEMDRAIGRMGTVVGNKSTRRGREVCVSILGVYGWWRDTAMTEGMPDAYVYPIEAVEIATALDDRTIPAELLTPPVWAMLRQYGVLP